MLSYKPVAIPVIVEPHLVTSFPHDPLQLLLRAQALQMGHVCGPPPWDGRKRCVMLVLIDYCAALLTYAKGFVNPQFFLLAWQNP